MLRGIIRKKLLTKYQDKVREFKSKIDQDKENILYDNGVIKDKTSNKSVSYWDFATTDDFQKLEIPDTIKESEISQLSHKNTQTKLFAKIGLETFERCHTRFLAEQ